jgi:hypothetical protein
MTLSAQVTLEAAEQIMREEEGRTMKKSASQELAADRTTALFFCAMLIVGVIYIVAALVRMRNPKPRSEIGLSKKLRSGVDDPGAVHRVRPWPCEDDGVPRVPESPCVRRKWEDDETEDPEETDKILTGH